MQRKYWFLAKSPECGWGWTLLIICWCKGEPIGKARREREAR